jgi:cytochrome c oxidase assembly protein subunit 15
MSGTAPSATAVRLWLWTVAGLIFAMVVVGGATRLTESGLSIVEWRPVTGTLPPLSQSQWQSEFEKYKTIPQYQIVNRGMSLDQFKTIYWWEWAHRLLGRVIGAAFLLPFLWFLWRGAIKRELRTPLAFIFLLGAVQGGAGWWMVYSGLSENIHVSHYRLAFHLTLACMIFVAVVWLAERLAARPRLDLPARIRRSAVALMVLVLAQIYLGGLVAGLHAGLVHNTWPLIEGALVPRSADLFFTEPLWRNFFENTLTVQFDHRMLAYALTIFAVLHAVDVWRTDPESSVLAGALSLAIAVVAQAALGVATLVYQAPLSLALAHQAVAMVMLTIATLYAQRTYARLELRSELKTA